MKHDEYTFTIPSGKTICAESWAPDGKARAAIAAVHGFGEHIGRYRHVAERFVGAGFLFACMDLPGHGRTDATHGDTTFTLLLDAVGGHMAETRRRNPGLPLVLYGHSLGGALVLRYCLERKADPACVIASSPLVRPYVAPAPLKVTMAKLMRRLLPSLVLRNPVELAALSRDPAVVEAARTDPQYHNLISTRFGWDLLRNIDWFASQAGRFPLPLLFMQGTADRVVDPRASLDLAARLQGDITVKTWDGFYHELHNEPERNQVIDFMVDWVNRRVPA
jgi:alpha-beta hydrolase superfamily lysophospholipase